MLSDVFVLHMAEKQSARTIELAHDLAQVGLERVIGRDKHVEAVLLDHLEVLSGVDVSLVQDPGK